VKEAIQNHRVLVGNESRHGDVCQGPSPKKVREHQDEIEFEEWIYGDPPQDVEFVRFIGDEVVRLEVMKVDGPKSSGQRKKIDLEVGCQGGHAERRAGQACQCTHPASPGRRSGHGRSGTSHQALFQASSRTASSAWPRSSLGTQLTSEARATTWRQRP